MIHSIILTFLLFINSTHSSDQKIDYKKEINCLLDIVEKSNGVFYRNGDKHSSKRARKHLEYKYQQATKSSFPFFRKVEVTTEKFIDKIASKSSFSGKPYRIQFGSDVYLTKAWLEKKLKSSCRTQS